MHKRELLARVTRWLWNCQCHQKDCRNLWPNGKNFNKKTWQEKRFWPCMAWEDRLKILQNEDVAKSSVKTRQVLSTNVHRNKIVDMGHELICKSPFSSYNQRTGLTWIWSWNLHHFLIEKPRESKSKLSL